MTKILIVGLKFCVNYSQLTMCCIYPYDQSYFKAVELLNENVKQVGH